MTARAPGELKKTVAVFPTDGAETPRRGEELFSVISADNLL